MSYEYESEKEKEIRKIIDDFVEKYDLDKNKKESENISQEDFERIKSKSIQDEENSKIKVISGETYKRKDINLDVVKGVAFICVSVLAIGIVFNGAHYSNIVDTYEGRLNRAIKEDGNTYVDDVKEEINHSKKDNYKNYKEAYENLDNYEYDFFGNRKDGTTPDGYDDSIDADSLIVPTMKQVDAIDNAVKVELGKSK